MDQASDVVREEKAFIMHRPPIFAKSATRRFGCWDQIALINGKSDVQFGLPNQGCQSENLRYEQKNTLMDID